MRRKLRKVAAVFGVAAALTLAAPPAADASVMRPACGLTWICAN